MLRLRALRNTRSLQVSLRGAAVPSQGQGVARSAGLSLAVARRITELHGGTLLDRANPDTPWASDATGEGAPNEIVLTLPID